MKIRWLALSLLGCGALSCAGTSNRAAVGPGADYRVAEGPPAPGAPVALPSLAVEWSPPVVVAGNVEALRGELGAYGTVAVMLGPSIEGVLNETQAYELVTSLSPQTKVVARGRHLLTRILQERGELPVRMQAVPDGSRDVFGRPNYVWEGVALDTTWKDQAPPLSGAQAMLVIDDASLDRQQWQQMPVASVGSCDSLLEAVRGASEALEGQLAPMRMHADAVLAQAYQAVVSEAMPPLVKELAPYERGVSPQEIGDGVSYEAYECGAAYREVVQVREGCQGGVCNYAPRLLVHEGVFVGAPGDNVYVASNCASRYGRDVRAEVDAMAAAAAAAVVPQLDPQWIELAQRAAALTKLEGTLAQVCTPQRRRFAADGIERARAAVAAVEAELQAPLAAGAGRWDDVNGRVGVPGQRGLEQFVRYTPDPSQPSARAAKGVVELEQAIAGSSACRVDANALPVVTLLTDVATSEVRFMGYFYAEELACGGLGPI